MRDHELAMLAYVKLADLSQQKRQLLGRDKFLLLAAAAACSAGWPEVAQRCQRLVLENNPSHLIGKFATMADALRDPEFQPFRTRLERFCTYEKAEHLLHELQVAARLPTAGTETTAGESALATLSGPDWTEAAS